MLGLIIIGVFVLYLLLSVWLVRFAARCARKRNIKGWKWGLPVALIMYLVVFWDHVPTLIAYKYYCDKYADFVVYKTLEQWELENPGVAETLQPSKKVRYEMLSDGQHYFINQRFDWVVGSKELPFSIVLRTEKIIDRTTGDLLVEYRAVAKRVGFPAFISSWNDYKFWLDLGICDGSNNRENGKLMSNFMHDAKHIGDNGNG